MKNKIKNKKEETNFPKRNDKKIKFEAFQYDNELLHFLVGAIE